MLKADGYRNRFNPSSVIAGICKRVLNAHFGIIYWRIPLNEAVFAVLYIISIVDGISLRSGLRSGSLRVQTDYYSHNVL